MAASFGGSIHDDIAGWCKEPRKGAVQVMVDLEKTVRSRKPRKLGFGRVMKPESG